MSSDPMTCPEAEVRTALVAAIEERDSLRAEVAQLRFDNNVLRRAMATVEEIVGRALSAGPGRQMFRETLARFQKAKP